MLLSARHFFRPFSLGCLKPFLTIHGATPSFSFHRHYLARRRQFIFLSPYILLKLYSLSLSLSPLFSFYYEFFFFFFRCFCFLFLFFLLPVSLSLFFNILTWKFLRLEGLKQSGVMNMMTQQVKYFLDRKKEEAFFVDRHFVAVHSCRNSMLFHFQIVTLSGFRSSSLCDM